MISARLIFTCLAIISTVCSQLSCDFHSSCCWSGDEQWQIQETGSININEFRRSFLVGRSKPPPAGAFLQWVESDEKTAGVYSSCPFCTNDGTVTVQYRHWQSPTSRLLFCLSPLISSKEESEQCHQALPSRQSTVTGHTFRVANATSVRMYVRAENKDDGPAAIVMIDRIRVLYQDCQAKDAKSAEPHEAIVVPPTESTSEQLELMRGSSAPNKIHSSHFDRMKSKLHAQGSRSPTVMRHVDKVFPKALNKVDTTRFSLPIRKLVPDEATPTEQPLPIIQSTTASPLPITSSVVPPTLRKDFNPLHDLLGEELANFLDPNYESDDEEEPEEEDDYKDEDTPPVVTQNPPKQKKKENAKAGRKTPTLRTQKLTSPPTPSKPSLLQSPRRINPPPALSDFHRPLPTSVPTLCSTPGGCLFQNGLCSWESPPEVTEEARFKRVTVGLSSFAQSLVPPSSISVLKTDSVMSEAHTIVFDALKYQASTRLLGCCFINSRLDCPFATPSEASHPLWQSSKFDCPKGTEEIVFLCENLSPSSSSICAIDNIRLHRSTDIFYLEPCQKDLISSL